MARKAWVWIMGFVEAWLSPGRRGMPRWTRVKAGNRYFGSSGGHAVRIESWWQSEANTASLRGYRNWLVGTLQYAFQIGPFDTNGKWVSLRSAILAWFCFLVKTRPPLSRRISFSYGLAGLI